MSAKLLIEKGAYKGDFEIVKQCIESGVDIEIKDYAGRTALFHAARWGHTEIVRYLISKGANVNVVDNKGRRPKAWRRNSPCTLI